MKEAEAELRQAGIDAAAAETEIILLSLLSIERIDLYLHGAKLIDDEILGKFHDIVKKRATRYPLQYILGEMWFYGRRFAVNQSVMVPTPETEILCETAVHFIDFMGLNKARVLDIGAGSGVIAVTVAGEIDDADVTAVDLSPDALEVARVNAETHGVADRISLVCSDLFSAIIPHKQFDLILSNPPYISEEEYKDLPPEVLADPKISLVAGEQGMDIIEAIVEKSPDYLAPSGRLIFEIGYNQADLVTKLTENDNRYISLTILRDLNDVDRVVMLGV